MQSAVRIWQGKICSPSQHCKIRPHVKRLRGEFPPVLKMNFKPWLYSPPDPSTLLLWLFFLLLKYVFQDAYLNIMLYINIFKVQYDSSLRLRKTIWHCKWSVSFCSTKCNFCMCVRCDKIQLTDAKFREGTEVKIGYKKQELVWKKDKTSWNWSFVRTHWIIQNCCL